MILSINEILKKYFTPSIQGNLPILSVFTDTRKPEKNGLFIALKGPQFDGHHYLLQAVEQGASALVCEYGRCPKGLKPEITVYETENPLYFYQKLAKYYLEAHPAKKIAITGSSGKTSTKEFLKALVSTTFNVYATAGNLNNQVGVPFSALQLKNETVAIFELGAGEPGDIERLSKIIKPDLALVTSVGEAHLEFFHSLEGVAKEKASIFKFSKKGFCSEELKKYSVFSDFDSFHLENFFDFINETDSGFSCIFKGQKFFLPFFGTYNLENFSLALAAASWLGVKADQIPEAIQKIQLPPFRQEKKEKNGVTFYLDCYNANPLSMQKACEGFSKLPGNKIMILGDMLELGADSESLHRQLGRNLSRLDSLEHVFFYGPWMRFAFESYSGSKKYFDKKENLISFLQELSPKDGMVFLKGSRGMRLEEIYEAYE